MSYALDELKQLPVVERIRLVEDLWDSIAEDQTEVDLDQVQIAEIERRRAEMLADPRLGIPWSEARTRLSAGLP